MNKEGLEVQVVVNLPTRREYLASLTPGRFTPEYKYKTPGGTDSLVPYDFNHTPITGSYDSTTAANTLNLYTLRYRCPEHPQLTRYVPANASFL